MVEVTDTSNATLTAASPQITVAPAPVTHFALATNPGPITAGQPIVLFVTAMDQFNNIGTAYSGTVRFTSSDSQAVLPG